MVTPDLRKVIGSVITCKASHVIALPECNRRYGALAKTKVLDGFVQNIIIDKSNPTARVQTYIKAEFDLGNGRSKIIKVHLRYVQLKEKAPPVLPPTEAQVVEVIDEIIEAEVIKPNNIEYEKNNDIDLDSLKKAANNADIKTLGPVSEAAKDMIAHNNELIAVLDSLNHSDTESEDDNTPATPEIASPTPDETPPTPDETPVATPVATPTITTFRKNVVFEAHGTKWYDIP